MLLLRCCWFGSVEEALFDNNYWSKPVRVINEELELHLSSFHGVKCLIFPGGEPGALRPSCERLPVCQCAPSIATIVIMMCGC